MAHPYFKEQNTVLHFGLFFAHIHRIFGHGRSEQLFEDSRQLHHLFVLPLYRARNSYTSKNIGTKQYDIAQNAEKVCIYPSAHTLTIGRTKKSNTSKLKENSEYTLEFWIIKGKYFYLLESHSTRLASIVAQLVIPITHRHLSFIYYGMFIWSCNDCSYWL